MEKEELRQAIKDGVKEGVKAHVCHFEEDERSVLKDVASGGLAFKRALIYIFVMVALSGLGFGIVKYMPSFKPTIGK